MSIDPLTEAQYRYRLARQHLRRAEVLYRSRDWAGTVQFAQLAIENFAKVLIALFEVPTWSHDPSQQLLRLLDRFPREVTEKVREVAVIAGEVAPEHSRSTYGEPSRGLTPEDLYSEGDAREVLEKAWRVRDLVEEVLRYLRISLST